MRSVLKTNDEVRNFIKKLKSIAVDTETTGLKFMHAKLEGVSISDEENTCYIYLADYDKGYINPEFTQIMDTLREFLDAQKLIGFHNAVYDLKILYKYGVTLPTEPELFCTMIGDHLIDENRKHGLKFLSRELLGVSTTDYLDIKDHSSQEFFDYAMNDAYWTRLLMTQQSEILKEQKLDKLFREIEMPFQYVLRDMQVHGILVDKDKVKEKRLKVQDRIQVLHQELLEVSRVDSSFNFNSSKQLAGLLFGTLGLEVKEVTPSGAPSVSSDTLSKLEHPVVNKLLEYKAYQKILSAYLAEDAQILSNTDEDNKVRPDFLDFGTTTGRLSCNSPNLQQLPKVQQGKEELDVRECFIVPEGKSMITCDYSGQELRVLTEITKEPVLIDTFNKGKDMHLSTANDFFNLNIPEEALYEGSEKHALFKDKYKTERNQAKVINFGMAYGKGAYGFAQDFNISETEAQEILDKYFAALPKVKESIEACHTFVRENGYAVSMTGRRRHFQKIKNKYGTEYYPNSVFRQSFNFLIQGFSADMIRLALVNTRLAAKKHPEYNLKIIATVHDEGVFEVNEEYVKLASELIKYQFEKAVTFCVPVIADIGVGKNYSESK